MSAAGKRTAAGPPGQSPPPAKRGPVNDFDDMMDEIDDIFNDDDVPEAYMPDVDDEGAAAEPDLCEAGRNWLRPPVGNLQPGCDALGEFSYTFGTPCKLMHGRLVCHRCAHWATIFCSLASPSSDSCWWHELVGGMPLSSTLTCLGQCCVRLRSCSVSAAGSGLHCWAPTHGRVAHSGAAGASGAHVWGQ